MLRLLLAAVLCAGSIGLACAQGTISDDDVSFVRGQTPWDGTPEADLTGVSEVLTDNHLYQTGWAFRVQGDTREFFFPAPTIQDYGGAMSENVWLDVASRGLFSAVETSSVVDGDGLAGGSPSGWVMMRMTLSNLSQTDPVSFDLFHVIDLDVGGSANGDTAELISPVNNPTLRFEDSEGDVGYYYGEDVDRFTVRTFESNNVFFALDDGDVDSFDDALPQGEDDYVAGMQWQNRTLLPGETLSFVVRFAINRGALTPDLSIAMQATPNPVLQGTPLDYIVAVANKLDMAAPNSVITFEPFAPAVQIVQTNGCDNDPIGYPECQIGYLGVGDQRQITLRVVPGAGSPPAINATATIGSPDIVDIAPQNNSATTITSVDLLAADLQIVKTNDTDDVAADIDGWNWQIELRNSVTATIAADFASGDRILLDQLPNTDAIYGVPALAFEGDENGPFVSGTAVCEIAAFDLTCTATSPMSFPPGTAVTVTVPVLAQALGPYANPRVGGECMADPDNAVSELIENNNFCADSVLSVDFMLFSDSFED